MALCLNCKTPGCDSVSCHPEDQAITQLRHDAEKRVSSWFEPHPDQTITVQRGDLQFLLDQYDMYKGTSK